MPRRDEPGPTPPPPLVGLCASAPFEGAWAEFVRRFKYPQHGLSGLDPAADSVVVELALGAANAAPGAAPGAVVPVPQHRLRLLDRGFHPAGVLASAIARAHRLPLHRNALVRLRDTPSQTGLSAAARRRNVAGAFGVPGAGLPSRIWLVDDVVTTGSTLVAAARAARRAGAREVVGLCAAWTPR